MTYKLAVKEKVVAMYQAGVSCREISLTEEIPLSTIRSWTVDVLLSPGTFSCAVCGKKQRTKNIQRRYCSLSCKNHANYQRRLKKTNKALGPRTCDRCGKEYQPKHGNDRYCSVKCRDLNKRERGERDREVFEQREGAPLMESTGLRPQRLKPVDSLEEKENFHRCLARCEQARRDAINDSRISGSQYRTELDTIEAYYQKYESSQDPSKMNQSLRDRIQDIFHSVR